MKRKLKAFTLIELLVVIAIIALLISILLPSLSRARELSKRLVCASNIKGVGTSAKIYANDNSERWMIPPFSAAAINDGNIDYLKNGLTPVETNETDPGAIGTERRFESTSETDASQNQGSTAVSTTRAFWLLVRSGDVTVQQFTCPSAGDRPDETENLDLYYDFTGYFNVSYGYQVPFGPRDTQPREGADNRMILSADKGPFYTGNGSECPTWEGGQTGQLRSDDSPREWRPFNSSNHGGQNNGEGQNCLYADGHASFQRTPAVGVDQDNIYTVMTEQWSDPDRFNLIHGDKPHCSPTDNPYPGQQALQANATGYSSTDSLIYP